MKFFQANPFSASPFIVLIFVIIADYWQNESPRSKRSLVLNISIKIFKDLFVFNFQCAQSTLDSDYVKTILGEYKICNADITLREDCTEDDLIDVIEGNRFVHEI